MRAAHRGLLTDFVEPGGRHDRHPRELQSVDDDDRPAHPRREHAGRAGAAPSAPRDRAGVAAPRDRVLGKATPQRDVAHDRAGGGVPLHAGGVERRRPHAPRRVERPSHAAAGRPSAVCVRPGAPRPAARRADARQPLHSGGHQARRPLRHLRQRGGPERRHRLQEVAQRHLGAHLLHVRRGRAGRHPRPSNS